MLIVFFFSFQYLLIVELRLNNLKNYNNNVLTYLCKLFRNKSNLKTLNLEENDLTSSIFEEIQYLSELH